jgi:hypothetical protein
LIYNNTESEKKIAIVGSKSLQGIESVYQMIDSIVARESSFGNKFTIINGGEEGVDAMAGEIALARDINYEIIPLKVCEHGCSNSGKYCFTHSYEPRSREIATEADLIYRIFDEGCGTSTCEVTARFGDELGKKVMRIPIDLLSIAR